MSLTPAERETTITSTDFDDKVRIWTCQRRYLTRLRRNPSFTQTKTGFFGTTEWAEFIIDANSWNPASGAKRSRNLSPEQRKQTAARLAAARASL